MVWQTWSRVLASFTRQRLHGSLPDGEARFSCSSHIRHRASSLSSKCQLSCTGIHQSESLHTAPKHGLHGRYRDHRNSYHFRESPSVGHESGRRTHLATLGGNIAGGTSHFYVVLTPCISVSLWNGHSLFNINRAPNASRFHLLQSSILLQES